MDCNLTGRKREDPPAAASVDRAKTKQRIEEGSVSLGIAAVDDDVGAVDHFSKRSESGARANSFSHARIAHKSLNPDACIMHATIHGWEDHFRSETYLSRFLKRFGSEPTRSTSLS